MNREDKEQEKIVHGTTKGRRLNLQVSVNEVAGEGTGGEEDST